MVSGVEGLLPQTHEKAGLPVQRDAVTAACAEPWPQSMTEAMASWSGRPEPAVQLPILRPHRGPHMRQGRAALDGQARWPGSKPCSPLPTPARWWGQVCGPTLS